MIAAQIIFCSQLLSLRMEMNSARRQSRNAQAWKLFVSLKILRKAFSTMHLNNQAESLTCQTTPLSSGICFDLPSSTKARKCFLVTGHRGAIIMFVVFKPKARTSSRSISRFCFSVATQWNCRICRQKSLSECAQVPTERKIRFLLYTPLLLSERNNMGLSSVVY